MAEIGKAYLQIIPKAEGITGKIENMVRPGAKSAGEKGGKTVGDNFMSGMRKTLTKVAIGGTVIAGFKAALDEGAKLQQSYGGLETIYGDAAEQAKEFAVQAQAAGISANSYAEQAVSFGASLKQAFGGDTTKAVEAANTAILDMTDNAAKMGTPIESIQNAYQGFAKQNYTMLDNLKLGYGGTKTEMERLLADASELSGVEYNIDNLGDVYEAIHVIQEDLGLTGVAAAEASETFSGSFGAMQASAANLLGALSTGGDVESAMSTLVTSAGTFFFQNFLPMVGQIAAAIPGAITTAVQTAVPTLLEKIPELIEMVRSTLETKGPSLLASGADLLQNIGLGLIQNLPVIQSKAISIITTLLGKVTEYLPMVLSKGKDIVLNLAQGFLDQVPTLIENAGTMVTNIISFLTENIPTIAKIGGDFLAGMAEKIISAIPGVIAAVMRLIPKVGTALLKLIPVAIKAVAQMIAKLATGITNGWNNIQPAIDGLIEKITKPLTDLIEKAKTIMGDVMTALTDKWEEIKGAAETAWETVKSKITEPIETAKSTLDTVMKKISGMFPVDLGKILKIQLPTIKVDKGEAPWGILGKGSPPSFNLSWNAKAMMQPYMFSSPTLFGAGEAGDEILYGRQRLMNDIKEATGNGKGNGNIFNINITVDGAKDPVVVADEIARKIKLQLRTV